MNEILLVIPVWFVVLLLVGAIVFSLNRVNSYAKPVYRSTLTVSMLIPLMLYVVFSNITHVNAESSKIELVDKKENSQVKEKSVASSGINLDDDRYQRGLENLKKLDGEVGEKVIESLKDIAPDLGQYIIEYPFGDIYNRSGLDLRSRQIATIAALTAMGDAKPQLKIHIKAGLNVGLTKEEITEIIMQMSVYSGFPRALNGIQAAKEVFADYDMTTYDE